LSYVELQCVSLRNWKILNKNGSISSRVLCSVIHRSPRATRFARPCGTMRQKKVCRCWDEYRRGLAGPWFSKRKLILIYRKGKKEKGRGWKGHLDMTIRGVSRETLQKRGERAGERQTKTYNGHNARWSTLEFSQGRRLHSTQLEPS